MSTHNHWQNHYNRLLKSKNDYLMALAARTAGASLSGKSQLFSFSNSTFFDDKGRIKLEAFDAVYEHYTIKLDRRLGVITHIDENQTTHNRTFVRRQVPDPATMAGADLVGRTKPTQYASEIYIIKASHEFKTALLYVNEVVKDEQECSELSEKLLEKFKNCVVKMRSLGGKVEIINELKRLNTEINCAIAGSDSFKKFKASDIHRALEYKGIWSGTTYQPHDVITIDEEKKTFEIETSASSAPMQLMIDLAIIANAPCTEKDKAKILRFIKRKMGDNRYDELEKDLQSLFDVSCKKYANCSEIDLNPEWYLAISDSMKKLTVAYYANADYFYKDFMCMPVKLSDSIHEQKQGHDRPTSMPVGMRGLFQLTEGWLAKDARGSFSAMESATSFRSGAPSRTGNLAISEQNNAQMKGAVQYFGEGTQLVSASLLTERITSAATIKAFVKGDQYHEPDRYILDAQHKVAKSNPELHRHRNAAVLMKTTAKNNTVEAYNINPDPFNMIQSFRNLKIDPSRKIFEQKGLKSLYELVQSTPSCPKGRGPSTDWSGFEFNFSRQYREIGVEFRKIKHKYAKTGDRELLKHIRLLEAIYTYQILSANHAKKVAFDKSASPVIETPLEYFSKQNGLNPLEDNQYDQWLLALENIIGTQFDALNSVTSLAVSEDCAQFNKIITHFYCKDGRDRTGMTAILFKFLNTQFDAGVSTLVNQEKIPELGTLPELSMIPMDNLRKNAHAFKKAHKRIVLDHSSAMLCGSPESSKGDYGLLSKLQGAAMGLVATAIARVRDDIINIMTESANLFTARMQASRWEFLHHHAKDEVVAALDDHISDVEVESLNRFSHDDSVYPVTLLSP